MPGDQAAEVLIVPSSRWLPGDAEHWDLVSRVDLAVARGLGPFEGRALDAIRSFVADGPASVGVSWGKDSVVVAHLAWRVDPGIPLWTASGRVDNPDSPAVRDAYLALTGQRHTRYPWREGVDDMLGWVNRHHEPRSISGVRADESRSRALSAATHGVSTGRFCRPILRWPVRMVWAYLALYGLPVHPAYAQSLGGVLDRDRIRVHSIGDDLGRSVGRREWEAAYYPAEVATT